MTEAPDPLASVSATAPLNAAPVSAGPRNRGWYLALWMLCWLTAGITHAEPGVGQIQPDATAYVLSDTPLVSLSPYSSVGSGLSKSRETGDDTEPKLLLTLQQPPAFESEPDMFPRALVAFRCARTGYPQLARAPPHSLN